MFTVYCNTFETEINYCVRMTAFLSQWRSLSANWNVRGFHSLKRSHLHMSNDIFNRNSSLRSRLMSLAIATCTLPHNNIICPLSWRLRWNVWEVMNWLSCSRVHDDISTIGWHNHKYIILFWGVKNVLTWLLTKFLIIFPSQVSQLSMTTRGLNHTHRLLL